jgi:rod shape-determining protein MreB
MRSRHSLFIDETAAERIKIRIGTAVEEAVPRTMEVKGRNVLTGLPKTVILTSEEVRTAIEEPMGQIVETIHGILEKLPPELASDIVDRGIVLTGGGAVLRGMDKMIEDFTGVDTVTVKDAMAATVTGTGRYAAVMSQVI